MSSSVDEAVGAVFHLRLGVFCADGNSAAWSLAIRVSKLNLYKPRFEQVHSTRLQEEAELNAVFEDWYTFYLPRDRPRGTTVGVVKVWDEDPVIYNSKLVLDLMGPGHPNFRLESVNPIRLPRSVVPEGRVMQDGSIRLERELSGPVEIAVRACDYGSPQLCSTARISVIPVSVTPPVDLKVEASTQRYQIVSWLPPSFGQPDSYTVTVDEKFNLDASGHQATFSARPYSGRQMEAVFFPVERRRAYFVTVSANLGNESTPTEPIRLLEILRSKTEKGASSGFVSFWPVIILTRETTR